MAEDIRYFKIGLFSLLAVGILVTGIVLLGVMDYFQPTVTIETYFLSQSVRGLEVGAPVKFLGVTRGKVTEIAPAGFVYHRDEIIDALKRGDRRSIVSNEFRNSIMVRMEIVPEEELLGIEELRAELFQALVDIGFRARLAQSGLAGPLFVDLEYVDPEVYPAPELPWEPEYFFIPSAIGQVTEFMSAATSILNGLRKADFSETFRKLDSSLQALNEFAEELDVVEVREDIVTLAEEARLMGEKLQEFLSDPRLESTLADLKETASAMGTAFRDRGADLGKTIERIPEAAARLDRITARTEELLDDQRIEQILDGMSQAAGNAGETMENAEATTAELRRLVRELNRLTMILNEDLNVITENLRRVTEDAGIITGELRDNPSQLLLGEAPPRIKPGESDKQEKQ